MTALSSNTKYYKEAYNLFQQCSQNEDRQDLANKVFDEASSTQSDTIKIAKGCSRELEKLLPFVSSHSILSSFFNRLTTDELDSLIRDRAGCFLLEKVLYYLPNALSDEDEHIHEGYDRLFECVCENFQDYIQETGSSHIIASTISFLHPLIKPTDSNEYEELIDGGQTEKKYHSLPSKWNVMKKLKKIGKLVKKSKTYNELVYATLLRICGFLYKEFYQKLINKLCSKRYKDLNNEHLLDKRSSYIFEVLLEFPSEQRDDIIYPLFLNHIDEFYLHPIGNIFFKHLLLTLNDKELLDKIYQLMIEQDRFKNLIEQCHIHLLITFIRVCERFNCHYEDFINRLNKLINPQKNNINDFVLCLLKIRAGKKYKRPKD